MECTPDNFETQYLGLNKAFAEEGCLVFHDDRPMTMALSVLVIIELLNALNRCVIAMLLYLLQQTD